MRVLTAACAALLAGVMLFAAGARAQTPEAVPPDVAFGRSIAMIRADLATGDELVKRRDWNTAYRHVMFPLEEVYGIIRDDVRTYKTPAFDGALKSLARVVKARNAKQYPGALQKVERALAAADAGLGARQPNKQIFVMQVATALLQTAPDEYDNAAVNGRIVRPISYQMARGYILQADRMFESVSPDLANADAVRQIRDTFTPLKQAFGDVNAPKQAPLDPEALVDHVRRIAVVTAALRAP